ncbi:MAG: AAA family ATPase [Thermoleophilia bacterium]
MRCTSCGFDNPTEMRFCGGCGARLSAVDQTAELKADSTALGSAPPALVASEVALPHLSGLTAPPHYTTVAGPAIPGERRLVTVLFADLSGFTARSEKLDPEAARDLITACFDRLVPAIERYGGTVDKFVGDEIMALFGAPRAHENDPERALRAAIDMRVAIAGFNRERRVPLAVHTGVNTGLVYAGDVGGGGRRDYSVMGDAVNLAARLKGLATPGEIVVGADTHRQAGHLFDWQAAGAVHVKGRAEPVSVYRLLGSRAAPASAGGRQLQATRGISSPLVGRRAELATLGSALVRLQQGEGGIVSVIGEAGLGKSRLVAEAREEARKLGVSWLEGRTLSFGRTISYWPFLEILQQDTGIESDDSEAERFAKLARHIETLFGDQSPEILPALATLLSLTLPEDLKERVKNLDGEAMGHQLFRSMLFLVRRRAGQGPVVVVFEDVHWLDESSAAMVEHVLSAAAEAPALFVLVGRPEVDSPTETLRGLARAGYAERYVEIILRPLSEREGAELVRNLIHLEELPAGLRETILQRAEGNPFFVEEVIRSLIDLGALAQDPHTGRWRVTEQAGEISIPGTVQGVILARIDRLDEDLKQVLLLASVIGRSFFYRVLDSIAEADRDLGRALTDLEARELVRERTRDPELEYIFKHALVQETTYESILLQRRRELHRRVASAIEELFADRPEEFYGLLAYHYSRAEDWEKAQQFLFKAGDQAGKIAADAEALAHYEQAMAAYSQAFGDSWDSLQRVSLERKMGEALFRLGEHARARTFLYSALRTLGSPYPTSRSGIRRAIAFQLLCQLAHRLLPWVPRRDPSAEAVRRAEERILPYWSLAWMDVTESPLRLVLDTFLVVNLAENTRIGWAAAMGYGGDRHDLRSDSVASPFPVLPPAQPIGERP